MNTPCRVAAHTCLPALVLAVVLAGCRSGQSPDDVTLINQRVGTNSYASIVAACRSFMPQYATVLPRELEALRSHDVDITLYASYRGFKDVVPVVLRDLGVRSLCVNRDRVLVYLDCTDRSLGLLAFRDGAQTFGTGELTNGLWYSNGTGSKSPRTYASGTTFK